MEGYALASIGDVYKDLEAAEEASDAYQKALEIAQQIEDQFLIFYLKIALARLAISQRAFARAEMLIKTANAIAKKSGSAYEAQKIQLELCALEFARKNYRQIQNDLEITHKYFSREGHIEDCIRAQVLRILVQLKLEGKTKTRQLMDEFMADLDEPARYIPSLVMLGELKEQFKSLASRKETGDPVSTLLQYLGDFQKLSQKSRRQIRKEATIVPFAQAKIKINAFGREEVLVKKRALAISDWKTQTSRDLFFLFLAHPEGLTKEEVGAIMWQDLSPAELKLRFKNAIYRMRHAIGSEVVLFQDNFYQFNRSIDYEYDVQIFLNTVNQAHEEKDQKKQVDLLRYALAQYKGKYLPGLDYDWVEPDRQRFHDSAIKCMEELTRILIKHSDYETALATCGKALATDPTNEAFYRLSMEIYSMMGNKAAVSRQYQQCLTMLKEDLDAPPSEATVSLYATLMEK
jgi:two-component SAPR family response regulator